MPSKTTLKRAHRAAREGKRPTTQAGEFVREEIEHIRRGKHGARSTKQAIAIGLSKARRAGIKLPPPDASRVSEETRRKAAKDTQAGQKPGALHRASPRRSHAVLNALKREDRRAASSEALARHAREAARSKTPSQRRHSARGGF
jgi:uncharacterized protein DUF6496